MLYNHNDTDDEGIAQASSQGGHWPGLDSALMDKLLLGSEEGLSGAVSSRKSSVAHSTVISARDAALQVCWEETAHVHMPTSPSLYCRHLCCV